MQYYLKAKWLMAHEQPKEKQPAAGIQPAQQRCQIFRNKNSSSSAQDRRAQGPGGFLAKFLSPFYSSISSFTFHNLMLMPHSCLI
jgi:hypothetical protein